MNSKKYRWLAFIFCITMVFSSFGGVGISSSAYADENESNLIIENVEEAIEVVEETEMPLEIQPLDVIDKEVLMMKSLLFMPFAFSEAIDPDEPGATFIDKTAEWVDEGNGIGKIIIDVWGNPVLTGSDVILVLDRSGSMKGTKLTNTTNAAQAFVDAIYASSSGVDSDNRLAIVTFSTSASRYPNATGETLLGVNDTVNGGTVATTYFTDRIDEIIAGGRTSYTAGFNAAKYIIDNRVDNSRPTYIVFMSDGQPNEGNGQTVVTTLKASPYDSKIYALGFGLTLSNFNNYIVPLASTPSSQYAIQADATTDLTPIFTGIAGEIRMAGTDAVVTDWLDSMYFELATAPAVTVSYETSYGSITTASDGSIVWNFGNITEVHKRLIIYIHLLGSVIEPGPYPTNTTAQCDYLDFEGVSQGIIAPIPTLDAIHVPALGITKSADKTTYGAVGELITYTYLLENTGNVKLDSPFIITDDRLGVITTTFGDLSPGTTGSATTTYAVTQDDLNNGEIVNVASASSEQTTSNDSTVTVTAVKDPQLELTKTADKTTYDAVGELITYTYLLENTGNVTLDGPFIVTDDRLGVITTTFGDLSPGTTGSATTTYAVTQDDLNNGEIVNIAIASCINSSEITNGEFDGEYIGALQENGYCEVLSNTSSAIVIANYTVTYLSGTYGNFGPVAHTGLTLGVLTPTPPAATTNQSNAVFTGWSPSVATTVSATIVYIAQWRTTGGGGGGGGSTAIIEPEVPLALTEDHIAYIQGYPENVVRPLGNVTREEVAVVFFRLLKTDYRETIRTAKSTFPDVGKARWSTKHIGTLVTGNIIAGYPDGTFRPGNPITRAELAVIASRFDNLKSSTSSTLTDINGHWAEKEINSAYLKGWVSGYPDGGFKPDQYITRAEYVTLVNNVLQRRVHIANILPDARQFPDLEKGKWYYEAMQEALNSHLYNRMEDTYEEWTLINFPMIEM